MPNPNLKWQGRYSCQLWGFAKSKHLTLRLAKYSYLRRSHSVYKVTRNPNLQFSPRLYQNPINVPFSSNVVLIKSLGSGILITMLIGELLSKYFEMGCKPSPTNLLNMLSQSTINLTICWWVEGVVLGSEVSCKSKRLLYSMSIYKSHSAIVTILCGWTLIGQPS